MKVWVNWFKSKTKTLGHKRALTLPYNLPRLFIFSQTNKLRVPQVTIRRPFGELNLGDQLRLEPHAVFHFFLDQSPLSAFLLGQIGKLAGADSGFPSGLQNKLRILLQQRSAISLIGMKDCTYGARNLSPYHFLAASQSFKPTEKGNFSSSNSTRTLPI